MRLLAGLRAPAIECRFREVVGGWQTFERDTRERPGMYRSGEREEQRRAVIEAIEEHRRTMERTRAEAGEHLAEIMGDGLRLSVRVDAAATAVELDRASRRNRALIDAGYSAVEIAEMAAEDRDVAALEAIRQEAPAWMRALAGRRRRSESLERAIVETMHGIEELADRFRDSDGRAIRAAVKAYGEAGEAIDALSKLATAEITGRGVSEARIAAAFATGDTESLTSPRSSSLTGEGAAQLVSGKGAGVTDRDAVPAGN
jgi:hypothetical protein